MFTASEIYLNALFLHTAGSACVQYDILILLVVVVNLFFTKCLNEITGQQSAFSIYIILTDGKIDDIGTANEEVGEFHYKL